MEGKQRLLVFGNCQAGWLHKFLQRQPEVAEAYDIHYLSDYFETPPDHPTKQPDFLRQCDVVVWQTAATRRNPDFLAHVSPNARQIRFPTLWMKLLWPTYIVDPRNCPEPDFPWGRHPYGDRLVLRLLNDGVPPAEIFERYCATDLNTIVNLDRFAKMTLAELRHNDAQSDIAVAPVIERDLREHKLFGTVNHPTYRMLHVIGEGVLKILCGPSVALPPSPANANDGLGTEEVPLHPQIIEHFGLKWAAPNQRWRYHSRLVNLNEFVQILATWEAVPLGNPPHLWLERANYAAECEQHDDAERILLEATSQYPDLPQFLFYAGILRLRRGQLEEAERLFRFGLQRFPHHAPFHHQLGVALVQRRLPAAALEALRNAQRLDPCNGDVTALLTRLQRFARAA